MRIEFRRTGGFGAPATNKDLVLEASTLPPNAQRELNELVETAVNGSKLAPDNSQQSNVRDAFSYTVTIDSATHPLTVSGHLANLPEAVRPLVHWLEKLAKS